MDRSYVAHPAEPQPQQAWTLVGLLVLGLFGFYVLALDQGWLLSLVQGARAFDLNLIHEAVHDARHVAGFPCH
jgi:cobalt transporter subunit CbtB